MTVHHMSLHAWLCLLNIVWEEHEFFNNNCFGNYVGFHISWSKWQNDLNNEDNNNYHGITLDILVNKCLIESQRNNNKMALQRAKEEYNHQHKSTDCRHANWEATLRMMEKDTWRYTQGWASHRGDVGMGDMHATNSVKQLLSCGAKWPQRREAKRGEANSLWDVGPGMLITLALLHKEKGRRSIPPSHASQKHAGGAESRTSGGLYGIRGLGHRMGPPWSSKAAHAYHYVKRVQSPL